MIPKDDTEDDSGDDWDNDMKCNDRQEEPAKESDE